MKTLITFLAVVLISTTSFAQTDNDYLEIARDVLKTEKKTAIAEAMDLSEAESQPFWTLYNEYQNKLYEVQNKRIANIKNFAANFDNITDEKADELFKNAMTYRQAVLKLEKSYYAKFKKIVPAAKAARFLQLEDKIETLIDAQLALEIPLIETN